MIYCLKLLPAIRKPYPVFNIIMLTTVSKDPISSRCPDSSFDSIFIDRQEK